jgi:HEAT repeat protein
VVGDLLREHHGLPPLPASTLSPADSDALSELARSPGQDQLKALSLLLAVQPDRALPIAIDILQSEGVDPGLRAAAAMLAARRPSGDVREALIGALRTASAAVLRIRLAQALAIMGGGQALAALEPLTHENDEAVRTQAVFSQRVIAHRLRMKGSARAIPMRSREVTDPIPFSFTEASVADFATLTRSGLHTYGVRFGLECVFKIECPRSLYLLALDAEIMRSDFPQALYEAPALLGLVAQANHVTGRFGLRWLLLSTPAQPGSAQLTLQRTTGALIAFGDIRGAGEVTFEVRSSATASGPPVLVRGAFRERRLIVTRAVVGSGGSRGSKRIPLPLTDE